jgi:hypothetical protein
MSDTPRTDAELDLRGEYLRGSIVDGAYDEIFYVMADFARQLERELAEAHRAYELARKDLLNLTEKVIPNLRAERDALKADAERERCARVCETLYEDGPRGSDQDSFATCQECAAAIRSGNAPDL